MASTLADVDVSAEAVEMTTTDQLEVLHLSDVEMDDPSLENDCLETQTMEQTEYSIANQVLPDGTTYDSETAEASALSDVEMDALSPENNGGLETQSEEQLKDNTVNDVLAGGMTYESGAGTESEEEYKIETPENLFNSDVVDRNEEFSPVEMDKETDNESDDDPRTAMQKRRALALQFQQEFLAQLRIKEMQDALEEDANGRTIKSKNTRKSNVVRKKTSGDPTFRFSGYIPLEKRKSARLQNMKPEFRYTDLPDDEIRAVKKRRLSNEDWSHIEDVVYEPRARLARKTTQSRPPIIPVEDVTEAMLNNIATKSSAKTHDTDKGTSCHQCRQKTIDTKTCCRNINCVGVRGQFCGCCIKNRYGEDAAVALLDPDWTCFVCRGVCNCSFCRAKAGKKPTGILAPIVQKYGYDNVQQFLEQAKSRATANDVRGFTADHAYAKDGKTQPLFREYKTLSELEELKKQQEDEEDDDDIFEGFGLSDDEFDEGILSLRETVPDDASLQQAQSEIVKQNEDGIDDNSPETSDKHDGRLFKISGRLFGEKKPKGLETPASEKKICSGTRVLGFSSDGRQAVLEGGTHVPLFREDL